MYAYHFFTKKYNVLTFDWHGFGQSEDLPINENFLCYSEFLLDYDAAIDFIKYQPEVDTSRIAVFGFSTGAYLSFTQLAKRDEISAFVGRALLTSFKDVIPLLKKIKPGRIILPPTNYPRNLLPINVASKINKPVFLIVGEADS